MPGEVITAAAANINAVKTIKCRVYGIAEQIKGRMFPEFRRDRNVIGAADLPRSLVRVMVCDPAPERNWTSVWFGYDPKTDILYAYREWPGHYEIPGVGYPGPWAVPSDRKMGVNDGDKGDAQEPFGFGYLAYKFEWARLERWHDYLAWLARGNSAAERCEDWDELEQWSETDGTDEPIEFRVIDARAGSQSKISMRGNDSLFEDVSRLAEGFVPASGQRIDVGVNALRDRVATGRFKVVEGCKNLIFAFDTYCGADGQKGACKDFVDCCRYAVLSGITDYAEPPAAALPGGSAADSPRNDIPQARHRIWW